ncbi:MAG: hypothetical protein ACUVR0_00280 [Candidatus Aminicenantales bacterium]
MAKGNSCLMQRRLPERLIWEKSGVDAKMINLAIWSLVIVFRLAIMN